ncbi:hypothetical protein PVAP13_2NG252703 [Panicum virgatum]|uniref:BED-type domain-containing protein n=1 Tax=Panicum virgatum TaxID=38727 RepID=A0A8T0VLI2_PANVG|nr:hypothetical protein PVAP13_2NG252703 [Panicum virgatum]KAG2634134.1 hypothetical protein PVAP13_2NG252703 [Panicum virgatum]KAG2634135.1 hypothetical protein PVAP13_2NG252703 [Panicum virgatum]
MSSSSSDLVRQRQRAVEVYLPEEVQGEGEVGSSVASTAAGSAASTAPDIASLVEKALAKLPPEMAAEAKDPKRKAKSRDPGWQFGWWPDIAKKDSAQCIFCKTITPSGISRFKQHLAGGYGDAIGCPSCPEIVRRQMDAYIKKNTRSRVLVVLEVQQDSEEGEGDEVEEVEPEKMPSSGTKTKQKKAAAKKKMAQASIAAYVAAAGAGSSKPANQKNTKSVVTMLRKTPEQVVSERHKFKTSQSTIEQCTKKENKQVVDDHVADFFYENRIPFNVINSRSWEIMLESIGQYGPGYRSPSYHEIRQPLLEKAVKRTTELRKKHEEAWKEYGCTLMSDGWTDTSHRHIINFLANSPAGTFFLGSVDASSEVASMDLLADLLEKQIDNIGREYVVQLVTDNGSNFKAAGRILMERIPHLFWTPCDAHCLNLLLQDIGEIKQFNITINSAKKVSRFLYKHGRLLDLMRQKIGGDLVRPAVTRFATSYLTLASMYKHKNGLRNLVVSEEWHNNSLSRSAEGKRVENIILSATFWTKMEDCLKASQPLLIALRIADGDETPAAPEITAAMDVAKSTIKESLKHNTDLRDEVLALYNTRWDTQMEQKLYGAALFLNPSKFFAIREKDKRQASRLRGMFNQVLWKMEPNDEVSSKISQQADDYELSAGESFSMPLAIRDRDKKNPIRWWGAYGADTFELQCLAKKIISLCCSASGCERNWSEFSAFHTKKRNRLEHKRLNDLVYVSYNKKMSNRFQKIQELGCKGRRSNPLLLEEFQWDNEWVDENCGDGVPWAVVDEAIGASENLRGRNLPRVAATRAVAAVKKTYVRNKKRRRGTSAAPDISEGEDDSDHDADARNEAEEDQDASDPVAMEEDEDNHGRASATDEDGGGFCVDVELLE